MFLIAPAAFAVLAFCVWHSTFSQAGRETPWREAFLATAVTLGVAVTFITESLSLLKVLAPVPVLLAWCGMAGLCAVLFRERLRRLRFQALQPALGGVAGGITAIGTAAFLGVTLLIAVIAPPNTWDSMTYHMPRVMHWIQFGTVAFHPTSVSRELWPYPFAEYGILHLQLLSGGDRFANLVQWGSSLTSAVGGSLIARYFVSGAAVQWLTALAAVTIPMGIMQATSTQNDYVTAGWLVCMVYYLLRLSSDRGAWMWPAVGAGLSLGLGALTKPTIAFFAVPFLVWTMLRKQGLRQMGAVVRACAVICLLSLVICCGHLIRISDFDYEADYIAHANQELSARVMVSTLLRSVTLHMGTNWPGVNEAVTNVVVALHRPLGLDVVDPLSTQTPKYVEYSVRRPYIHEDHAGNPWHLLLFTLTFLWAAWQARRGGPGRDALFYCLCVVAGACLVCLIGRWSPWNSRFHLPLFVVSTPVIAQFLAGIWKSRLAAIAAVLLAFSSVPHLLDNHSRPLRGGRSILELDREHVMFNNRSRLRVDYAAGLEYLNAIGCTDIGLALRGEEWEYPLWPMAARRSDEPPVLRHVRFHPESVKYAAEPLESPCALIASPRESPVVDVSGVRFRRVWESEKLSLYQPEE
jgi:dolichyl-phosphate-mannose-protein mannosyltransferase